MRRFCLFLGLGLSLLFSGCVGAAAADVPLLLAPVGVQNDTFIVERGRIARLEQYPAIVRVESEALFFREAPLPFGSFEVLVGQEVREGDVLARLDTSRIEERLEERRERISDMQIAHAFTNQQMERAISIAQTELLSISRRITEAEGFPAIYLLESADLKRLEIQRLQVELQQAREWQAFNLSYYQSDLNEILSQISAAELRAPFDGVISYRAGIRQGAWVEAFRPLIYISEGQKLFVEYTGRGTPRIFRESLVYANIDGVAHEMERIVLPPNEALIFTRAAGTIPFRFSFAEAIGDAVQAGQFVQLMVYQELEDGVLRIPPNALFFDEEMGTYVNLIENGQRIPIVVETGLRNPAWVEVLSGLLEGDEIIVQQ